MPIQEAFNANNEDILMAADLTAEAFARKRFSAESSAKKDLITWTPSSVFRASDETWPIAAWSSIDRLLMGLEIVPLTTMVTGPVRAQAKATCQFSLSM